MLADLEAQLDTSAVLSIILVDDHSTDESYALCQTFAHRSSLPIALVQNRGEAGKKAALRQGIALATSDYILTTDADCRLPNTWFGTVAELVGSSSPDLGILSLALVPAFGFFEQMQQQEFATIMAATAAMAKAGHPSMANGANLVFRRKLFMAYEVSRLGQQVASGDDIFLLHFAKKTKAHIIYSDAVALQTRTKPEATIMGFAKQRLRWAGKWTSYADLGTVVTAIGVWLIHLVYISTCVALIAGYMHPGFLFMVLAKGILEYRIISKTLAKSSLSPRLLPFLALQVCYSPYVVFTGLLSNIPSLYIWKGRRPHKYQKERRR